MLLTAILVCFTFSAVVDGAGRADADALLRAGRYRDAALAYISLLHNSPDDPDLLDGAGKSMMGLAAPQRAIPYFERETALQPLRWDAARRLSEAYRAAGRFQDAQQLLTRMTASDPSDGRLWAELGILSYKKGYYAAAVASLDRALAAGKGLDAPRIAIASRSFGPSRWSRPGRRPKPPKRCRLCWRVRRIRPISISC